MRMKTLSVLLLLVCSAALNAADFRYISDELRVPLRVSPCSSCKIVHRGLVAGTRLELQSVENDWAKVTTESGLTGWLPAQYLLERPIAKQRLNAAEANTNKLLEENAQLQQSVNILEDTTKQQASELSVLKVANEELESELTALKKLSTNAINLQEQNETLIKENRILQSEVDVLTASRDQLASDNSRKWFFFGGVTVFLGAILAVLLPQIRPRKRFTEWG
jgi:SH3 domain protein